MQSIALNSTLRGASTLSRSLAATSVLPRVALRGMMRPMPVSLRARRGFAATANHHQDHVPMIPVEVWPLGLIVASAMSFGLYVGYSGFHSMRTDTTDVVRGQEEIKAQAQQNHAPRFMTLTKDGHARPHHHLPPADQVYPIHDEPPLC